MLDKMVDIEKRKTQSEARRIQPCFLPTKPEPKNTLCKKYLETLSGKNSIRDSKSFLRKIVYFLLNLK
jgi:hypothetical protein